MDLAALSSIQIAADERRGFPTKFEGDPQLVSQLHKDLVGLLGEIGEFANLVKKIGIKLDRPEYIGPSLTESRPALEEELVDSMIYIMRIAAILGTDLEAAVLKKVEFNRARYESLERP